MSGRAQHKKPGTRRSAVLSDTPYEPPVVDLIARHQWLYIQRKHRLSPRELEVAELVCRGLTNAEIGAELEVRRGTVKTHLKSIFAKTHTRSKITLLLRFLTDVNELLRKSGRGGRVPIVELRKRTKRTAVPDRTPKKTR